MLDKKNILDIVLLAAKALNEENLPDNRFLVSKSTLLFGVGAELDSLSLVSLIVDIEANISEKFGRQISLTDDRAMSQNISPFTSIQTLADYIALIIEEDV